jgi:sulfur transfer protein SufE
MVAEKSAIEKAAMAVLENYNKDTIDNLCYILRYGSTKPQYDEVSDIDQSNPVDCSSDTWAKIYRKNPDLFELDQSP